MATRKPRLPIDNQIFGQQLGPDWKAIKILGSGSNGILTLWEYHGDPQKSPPINQIASKQ